MPSSPSLRQFSQRIPALINPPHLENLDLRKVSARVSFAEEVYKNDNPQSLAIEANSPWN